MFDTLFLNNIINLLDSISSMKIFYFNFLETSYSVHFDNVLDLNNNLLNLPLPASEKMNSLIILYLEVSYMTIFIFFIVSLVLLELILVYSRVFESLWRSEW